MKECIMNLEIDSDIKNEESKEDLEYLYIEIECIVKILDIYINYEDEVEKGCLFFLTDNLKTKINQIQRIYMQ